MNKISKYLQFIEDGKYTVLFNLKNETYTILNETLAQRVKDRMGTIDSLETMHPELFRQMKTNGMIVPADLDETAQLVYSWKHQDCSSAYFSMIINPTLNCNLRCWYCYETHQKMPMMNADTLRAIKSLIDRKVNNPELKGLNISFFGGEPLLGFREVVRPILEHASQTCKEHGIGLTSNFTTNAVLLTDEILDFLNSLDYAQPATFQISLDGNREYHNQIRIGPNRIPTYDAIIDSIRRAAMRGHKVSVRINYTAENLLSFTDVLTDFKEMPEEVKNYIRFNYQRIWQDRKQNTIPIENRLKDVIAYFKEEGFWVDSDEIYYRHCCYADRENNIVINYDGMLFKCTARDFTVTNSEGRLLPDGTLAWNGHYARRMRIKYANPACLACSILPICNGGCTQGKLEAADATTCYRHMSEVGKLEYIFKRLKQIIAYQNKK